MSFMICFLPPFLQALEPGDMTYAIALSKR
jgi:hypothetical protein